jgi:hypothetical protein
MHQRCNLEKDINQLKDSVEVLHQALDKMHKMMTTALQNQKSASRTTVGGSTLKKVVQGGIIGGIGEMLKLGKETPKS